MAAKILRNLSRLGVLLALLTGLAACGGIIANGNRHNVPLPAAAVSKLASMGSSPGEAMMIRIFKETSELEVWKRTKSGAFKLFDTYQICAWSGELGPKIKEGDRQAPEGFYTITPALLNPKSSYYLSFNTGFPNKYDRAFGRTGTNLMVHGDCSSSGCYAMTDEQIKVVYALARESFEGGNASIQLQMLPFRMTPQNLARHASSPNLPFWNNLKEGSDQFELTKSPPLWDVCDRKYIFNSVAVSGAALDAKAACPALQTDATLTARLLAKQAADAQIVAAEVNALDAKEARDAAETDRLAREQATIKARGAAIGGFVSGILGTAEPVEKVFDTTIKAPIPMPPIKRG